MVCRVNRYKSPITRTDLARELARYRKFLHEARATGNEAAIVSAEAYISACRSVAKYVPK